MNIAFTPEAVAAEVAYRFETGRVHHAEVALARHRRPGMGTWLRRVARPTAARHHAHHAQRA